MLKQADGVWHVTAHDEEGRTYYKAVKVVESNYDPPEGSSSREYGYYGKVINFGWPCEYYVKSLLRMFPFQKDLVIDMSGRNHNGSKTVIKKKDLNVLFAELKLI